MKIRYKIRVIFFMTLLLFFPQARINGIGDEEQILNESYKKIDVIYKRIGNELVGIRKQYPNSQSKIYHILDLVDNMYKASKNSYQTAKVIFGKNQQLEQQIVSKEIEIKEAYRSKDKENISLQNEVIEHKNEISAHSSVLETTQKNLEAATVDIDKKNNLIAKLNESIAKLSKEKKESFKNEIQGPSKETIEISKEKNIRSKYHKASRNSNSAPNSPR
jgi:hypothetical protein